VKLYEKFVIFSCPDVRKCHKYLQLLQIACWYSWCKGIYVLAIRSPVVDKGRTRPGHWLGFLLYLYSFSALTMLV